MNRKTAYLIPAFAAVFALMFSVGSPLAMAEYSEGMHDESMAQKHKKMHKVIKVEGFVGSIQITEDSDRETLKEQITVSLSDAAQDLDVRGGHIGAVINENGDKYVAWLLKSFEKDSESEIVTATIYVVDAGDASNTTTVTKEFEHPKMNGKFGYDGDRQAKLDQKIDRLSQPTGDVEVDSARAAFVEKLQELKTALENGDSERVSELRAELQDLRSELGNIRSYRS